MAFLTKYNNFKYEMMLLSLFNALASFLRYINMILAEKFNIFMVMYLDNIIIYTKDPTYKNHTISYRTALIIRHLYQSEEMLVIKDIILRLCYIGPGD